MNSRQVRNIIAFRNDRFGEFLLNIPAFRSLKKGYPEARLTLVVNPYLEELARQIDCVDDVMTWENKKHKFNELIKFSKELRRKKFDLCIIFNPSREFNIVSFFSGIPERIGYNHKLAFLLTKQALDKKYLGAKHEIEYNLELASIAAAKTDEKDVSLPINEKIADSLFITFNIEKDACIVVIHPWTSDPVKQWPVNNFYELARRLAGLQHIKVLIIGGKEEIIKGKEFFSRIEEKNIINLVGKTTLLELAALLKRSKLLISGDSGPVHLASAVNTPVIAIFRNDIPAKSAKRWGPWGIGHTVIEKNNLRDISIEEVFNKVKERL